MAESTTPTITSLNAEKANSASTTSDSSGLNATLAAQIAEKIKANSLNGETDDLTSFETKKKVNDVKQKVYVFVLAIVAYLLYTYATASFDVYNANTDKIVGGSGLQQQISSVDKEIQSFKTNEENLKMVTRESDMNNLVNCINNSNLCDKVLPGVKKNLQVTRSYLLLTPLNESKMEIDQKSLLKYFNEYLLVGQNGLPIGQILNISFTSPSLIDQAKQIYEIGVDTTMTFPNKDSMMEMITKIESGLNPDNPLLIKISFLNYDIVKFEEPQTVAVSFVIYQYKK